MRYIVKGDAMERGGRATAQAVSASGRFAVGLFGGGRHEATDYPSRRRPSFPPRTLVLVNLTGR
jgi:hypothetical protein